MATLEYLQYSAIVSAANTYTFTNISLGAVAADRDIIVNLTARSALTITSTSVTVAGVAATKIAEATNYSESPTTNIAAIYKARVPAGATGNVVAVFSSNAARTGIGVYRATGIAAGAIETYSTQSDPRPYEYILATAPDGLAIGNAVGYRGSQLPVTTWSWAGVAKDYQHTYGSGAVNDASGASVITNSSSLTIGASVSGTLYATTAVFASFAPRLPASTWNGTAWVPIKTWNGSEWKI